MATRVMRSTGERFANSNEEMENQKPAVFTPSNASMEPPVVRSKPSAVRTKPAVMRTKPQVIQRKRNPPKNEALPSKVEQIGDEKPAVPPVKAAQRKKIDVVVVEDSDAEVIPAPAETKRKETNATKGKRTATKKKTRPTQDQETTPKKQTTLTDHFKVRRSGRAVKNREIEVAQDQLKKKILNGVEEGLEIRVMEGKGRGIFSTRAFAKGDFVCEYAGELISVQEARAREIKYAEDPEIGSYMYFFSYKNKKHCIDATAESDRLGRLLNHSKTSSNVSSRLFPINDVPYLILYATTDIEAGVELLYDYGDRSKKSLDDHPWLAS